MIQQTVLSPALSPDKAALWLHGRLKAGAVAGAVGRGPRFQRLHPDAVTVTSFDPLRSHAASAADIAVVLGAAVGLDRADRWVEFFEALVRGLQLSRTYSLADFPQLIRNETFRLFAARDLTDGRIRSLWQVKRWGVLQRAALADTFDRLLFEMAPIASSREPLPAVPLCCLNLDPRTPGSALAAALFATAIAGRRRSGQRLAIAIEVPRYDRLSGDDALEKAAALFLRYGSVRVVPAGDGALPWRWQQWIAKQHHADRPHSEALPEPTTSLYELATSQAALTSAWPQIVRRGAVPGSDGLTAAAFGRDLYAQMYFLASELRDKRYAPMPLQRLYLQKPNGTKRVLGIPTLRDRLLQLALVAALTPIVERLFLDCSYAYRPGRNAHDAIAVVERARGDGFLHVVNADIRHCFDSLNHDLLFDLLDAVVRDRDLVALIRTCVQSPIALGRTVLPPLGRGVPQGAPLSPMLANIYLHTLDRAMVKLGLPWVRYADDFICLARTAADARSAAAFLEEFVTKQLALELKLMPHVVTTFGDTFEFLGFVMEERRKRIAPARMIKLQSRFDQRLSEPVNPFRRLRRVNALIAGFGGYYNSTEPTIAGQLAAFDEWGRERVRTTLGEDFVARMWSINRAPREERDFYIDLSAAEDLQELRDQTDDLMPDSSDDEAASPQPAVAPVRHSPEPPAATVAAPPAADAEGLVSLRSAFVEEGNDTAELRDFLAATSTEGAPALSADGVLSVTLHGATLGVHSRQLVLRKGGLDIGRIGFVSLRQVIIQAIGVTVTSTLLRALADAAIPVHFLDWKGRPYGQFGSMSRASPRLLRSQVVAATSDRAVQIATSMLHAKAANQLAVLRLYTRYRFRTDPSMAARIGAELASTNRDLERLKATTGGDLEALRGRLLAIEGRLAAAYFRAVGILVSGRADFARRERQSPGRDNVNVLLDYTYGLLYTRCHRALVQTGLDPRLGFVHTDRAGGKLSLVYDFVEEFRGVAADRVVLALISRGVVLHRTKQDILTLPTRRKIARAFERNLTNRCRYRTARLPLAEIIDAQAKHLADILLAETPYRPFRYNH